VPAFGVMPARIKEQIAIEALYAPYTQRQAADVAALDRDRERSIPSDFDYLLLSGLSRELMTKLLAGRPENMAQAARIEGMTPAALMLILSNIKGKDKQRRSS
jgi:tRNA uridine 5-carboxymethylaminomethyl modification enzyme